MPTHRYGIAGFFRMDAIHKFSGKRREVAPWFPNLALTNGLNYMGSNGGFMDYCQVGTANNTPNVSDTGLYSWLAGTNNLKSGSSTYAARSTTPYYGYRQKTWRFTAGTATGNIQEVGVGWGSSGATLLSRALPINELGESIAPTVLSDEILDVTYQLRYYPPTADLTGTVTLDGTVYDTTIRASVVTNQETQASIIGTEMGYAGALSDWKAYDGNIGTIIQAPSGISANLAGSLSNQAYSNNSFERKMDAQCSVSGWNLGSGIRSIYIETTGGAFQTEFSAQGTGNTIPKTNLYTLTLVWKIAWSAIIIMPLSTGTYSINGQPVSFSIT
jgi:hypothetical protein